MDRKLELEAMRERVRVLNIAIRKAEKSDKIPMTKELADGCIKRNHDFVVEMESIYG